jgi:hypothetical protein
MARPPTTPAAVRPPLHTPSLTSSARPARMTRWPPSFPFAHADAPMPQCLNTSMPLISSPAIDIMPLDPMWGFFINDMNYKTPISPLDPEVAAPAWPLQPPGPRPPCLSGRAVGMRLKPV